MEPDPTNGLSDDQLADLARLADGTLPADRRAEVESSVAASPQLSTHRRAPGHRPGRPARHGRHRRPGAAARARRSAPRRGPRRWTSAHQGRDRRRDRGRGGSGPRPGPDAAGRRLGRPERRRRRGARREAADPGRAPRRVRHPAASARAGRRRALPELRREVWLEDRSAPAQDDPSGRHATTVYYEKGGRTIAYTIVSGDALDPPSNARSITRGGVEYRVFRDDGRAVVTWERDGRTCVLSSTAARPAELLTLADWRGKGAITF